MSDAQTQNLFVYGTLRDDGLRAAVLGHDGRTLALTPATAPDYATLYYPGEIYPALVPRTGAIAEGLVIDRLSAADCARLDFYEGTQYYLGEIAIVAAGRTLNVRTYLPVCAIGTDAPIWRFSHWQRAHRKAALAEASDMVREG